MRKMKRVLSFIMACVMLFSSANTGVYATEISEPVIMVEEGTEIIDEEEVFVVGTEIVEATEESETVDITESVDATEMEDSTESLEEMDSTAIVGNTEEYDEVVDYNDLMPLEVVPMDLEELEGEIYDADELLQMAENMPSLMSESYGITWGDATSYYIYNRLSKDEQKLWSAMEVLYASYLESEVDIINSWTDYVRVQTTEEITYERLVEVLYMFRYSHPQYYFLNLSVRPIYGDTYIGAAYWVYDAFADGTARKAATNEINTLLEAWSAEVSGYDTEEEQVKAIHDLICNKVDYNYGVLEGDDSITTEEEAVYFTQSAYSVFCTDLTVCAGYTQAFTWVCNVMGIEVTSVTSPNHAWNKVKVNDNWYNVDVTWDDGVGVGNRYYYCYLRNDAYIDTLSSHAEEDEWIPYLPSCTLDSGSDYWETGTLPEVTGRAATPVISIEEEDNGYNVTIESATNGAEIFYTLDGKTPSEANSKGNLYKGTFQINQTATIRAIAVCDGYLDSVVAEGGSIDEIEYIVDSGLCGTNVTWQLDSKGVLTISGSGDMESYASADAVPWYTYSQNIQSVKVEDGVTALGDYVFSSLSNLQAIELASSITKIGAYAFYYSVLEEIKIPVGVTEIGEYAFYNSDLTELEIPASVTEIGTYAFAYCYDLVQVKICGNPTTIGERVFENCDKLTVVELSDTYTKIADFMFFDCDGLVNITLPESLTEIGWQALSGCTKLEEITIPAKVVMQSYAFYSSTGLKKVTIENGVTAIPYGAFNGCTALEEIRIPKSVTSIGNIAIDVTATIYGHAGSAAETYASNNGNVFVDISNTEYEVHFVTGTEEQITSVIYQRDALITEPVLGERTGYTFDGWYTSDEIHDETTKWDFENDTVTKSITLYAYWIPNEYEVTFNAGEGTLGTTKITVTYDAVYGELPTPVRENYTFLGWYTALEGGTLVDAETIVATAGNHTLYALYEVAIVASDTYDGAFGKGEWKLDALGTMTISGYAGPWYNIASEYKEATLKLVLEEGITSIDDSAFMNFVNATKVVLPESLTEIGSQAFMGCSSLAEINLPNSVTTIGEYAFNNCTALQQIILPNGLTEISPYVFAGCRLTAIEIPASVTKIGNSAFFGCSFTNVTIPGTVTEIEEYAFNACKNLENITLSANITYIGEGLFAACEKLSAVTIPAGVTGIGAEAFRECRELEELVIPENVETIGANAFESCVSLTEIVVPENVKTIGANAFEGCTGLTEMTIPGNVKTLGEELFYGCDGLTSVIFEEGVEILGARALYDCNNLEYVYLAGSMSYDAPIFNDVYCDVHTKLLTAGPKSGDYNVEFGWTKEMPSYAFANLVSLQSCVIPDTVTKIGERAFMSTGLVAVDIPSSVTTIGDAAFIDCNSLTQVYIPKTVTSIGMMAFASTTTIKGFLDSAAHDFAVENGNTFINVLDEAIKVSFVTGIETELETQYYLEVSLITEPTGLEKIGYTLEGWYTSDTTQDETTKWDFANDKATDDITLYAKWMPNTYQLSYNLNYEGADKVEGKSVTYEAAYGTLYEPGRTGYTFLGWFTAEENGEQVTEEHIYTIASDSTIYAYWKADSYTVTFDANGGEPVNTELLVTYDSVYGELPVPAREGYEFIGWFTDKNGGQGIKEDTKVTITAPQTLYACWKASIYEVTFDTTGGVEITDKKEVTFGEPYGELPIIIREGSAFIGWCLEDGTDITAETIVSTTEDHTLYAKWGYKVAALEVKPLSGEVERGTRVAIETTTNGAKIYYTTSSEVDLTVSAINGTLEADAVRYEDEIEITEAVTIYAIAIKEDYVSSDVLTVSYTVKDESQDWGDIEKEEDRAMFTDANAVPTELWVAGIEDCDYTGKAITYPDLRVYSHKTLLVEKVDYTVKYKNNKNAGTATITITGKGNYTGSIVETFEIRKLDIRNATVLDVAVPYNGKVQKATTTVTYLLDGKTITLKKGTDFTYTYPKTDSKDKENYDADAFREVNEETGYTDYMVTITGKGNYTGTTTFTQRITKQYVIGKMKLTTIKSQPYNEGNPIEPEIILMNGAEKMVGCKVEEFVEGAEVDFTVKYENNTEVGTATVTITGNEARGYVGTRTTTFKITGTALSKAKMSGFVSSLPWSETPVTQNVTFTYATGSGENKVTRELKGCNEERYEEACANGEKIDYTVRYEKNTTVGTATVIYTGKRGFTGTIKKTFKITGLPMNKAVVENLVPSIAYDGEEVKVTGYDLKYIIGKGDEAQTVSLKEGENYTVSYKNNTKAGTATIIFTGINGYTGTLKKTFKITAYVFDSMVDKVRVTLESEYPYTKGTVTPKPEVKYTNTKGVEILLKEGTDYTLSYSNNKAVADKSAAKAPTVTITGKNGFKGKLTEKFSIVEGDLSEVKMTATDISYQNKGNICKPKIVLTDTNGKKLVSNTDYNKNIVYTYARDVEVTQLVDRQAVTVKRYEGEAINNNDIIPVGAEIKATVTGIKNYSGMRSVIFRYVAGDMAKATIKVADQVYTGKEVKPTKDDITVKIGNVTLEKTDYVIDDYINNEKKGTAKIIIRGIGNYGGEKTVTFKITTKTMNYTIVYDKNADDAAGKMKDSVIPSGKNLTANAYKRTGYTFVGWNTKADGSGQGYTNKEAFSVNDSMWIFGRKITLFAKWAPTEYKITYKLNGGTNSAENPIEYNIETTTILLKEPSREGYVFDGWYSNSKFSSKSLVTEITTGSTGNKTLYAKWIKV